MPKVVYETKRFQKKSLALIDKINIIIDQYNEQGYDLTLRQIFYQLVTRNEIANSENCYDNLGTLMRDARMAGLIDWFAIEDRTRFCVG